MGTGTWERQVSLVLCMLRLGSKSVAGCNIQDEMTWKRLVAAGAAAELLGMYWGMDMPLERSSYSAKGGCRTGYSWKYFVLNVEGRDMAERNLKVRRLELCFLCQLEL